MSERMPNLNDYLAHWGRLAAKVIGISALAAAMLWELVTLAVMDF